MLHSAAIIALSSTLCGYAACSHDAATTCAVKEKCLYFNTTVDVGDKFSCVDCPLGVDDCAIGDGVFQGCTQLGCYGENLPVKDVNRCTKIGCYKDCLSK